MDTPAAASQTRVHHRKTRVLVRTGLLGREKIQFVLAERLIRKRVDKNGDVIV